MKHASILSIGTELTLGQSVDTNSAWLAAQLALRGIRCRMHRCVPDELPLIIAAVRDAARESELVIITGGLGPTDDDLTREALAAAAECALREDPASLAQLRSFFERRNRPMPDRNRVQARIPTAGHAIENKCGTAPGIALELAGTPIFALPGVPFEMKAMFADAVAPRLRPSDGSQVLRSRIVRTYGKGESDIGEAIRDLMVRGRNPEVGTTAALGQISVRINAAADTAEQALTLLDDTEQELRRRLGWVVFGVDDDTLAGAVGMLLQERGATLSTAESCTGGLVGQLLTDSAGASAYYVGGAVVYSNAMKRALCGISEALLQEHGAVSEPVAAALARGSAERFGTDYALAISGVAGPSGGTADKPVGMVCIGMAARGATAARTFQFGADSPRDVIRMRSALTALNWLRRELLDDAEIG